MRHRLTTIKLVWLIEDIEEEAKCPSVLPHRLGSNSGEIPPLWCRGSATPNINTWAHRSVHWTAMSIVGMPLKKGDCVHWLTRVTKVAYYKHSCRFWEYASRSLHFLSIVKVTLKKMQPENSINIAICVVPRILMQLFGKVFRAQVKICPHQMAEKVAPDIIRWNTVHNVCRSKSTVAR